MTPPEEQLQGGRLLVAVSDGVVRLLRDLAGKGRKVIAFMNASHQDPDLTAELFVLEPEDPGEAL